MPEVLTLYHTMTEDDGEFKPNESTISNLTSLFDSNKPHPNENHSLTYVAPKAPKAGENSGTLKQSGSKGSSNQKLKIITSKSVQVYKLENGNYVNLGTAGIAIVGNHDLHLYQVILYKNNKDHLCKTHITPNFSLTVLQNNYMSFYDNSGQNWSIMFTSSCNVQEFAKQVAIAKYNSQINQERIIVQDMSPLGGAKAKENDIMEVAYTCSVLENDEVVPWKEKESMTVELTDVNDFPWYEGLRDWREHCKRIVIIPYRLTAPWTNDINKNTCIVMELELVRITSSHSHKPIMQKSIEKEKSEIGDRGVKTKGGSVKENSEDEGHCKGRATSLKEGIFSSRSHKTDIISRIAKMGKGFPVSDPTVCAPSDSEDECSSLPRRGLNLNSVKNAVQQLHRSLPIHLGQCSAEVDNSHCSNAEDEVYLNEEPARSQEQKKMRNGANVIVEEWEPCRNVEEKELERNQSSEASFVNGELWASIHKLSEKVDEVLKKLQNLDYSKWERFEERESVGVMDPLSVLTSIPNFITEHENLKTEMELQRRAIDEQNKKIETLTDLTHRCVEKCFDTERRGTLEKQETLRSEKQVEEWKKLSEANARINESACDAEIYRRAESSESQHVRYGGDLVEKPRKKEGGVHDLERKLDHTVAEKGCQVNWNGGETEEILNDKSKDIEETCCNSKAPESKLCEDSSEDIKRVMNAVNKKLQGYFEPGMNYSGSEVKEIIASTLKDVTVEYLRYKSKLRRSSGTEFSTRNSSERRFGILREQRTEEGPQESSLSSHVRETFDSTGQRNSRVIRSVTPSGLTVNTSAKDIEPELAAEKSGSLASEMVSKRSAVSPEQSGLSRVSNITEVTRDHSYGRDTYEDGRKSASDSAKDYSKTSSRTHRLSFADEDPIFEKMGETGSRGKGSPLSLRRTLRDAGEESEIGSSSRRLDNVGVKFSEHQRISQQEIFVGSKSFIECRDDNVEDGNCEITVSRKEEDREIGEISPSPSQRPTSIAEEQTLDLDKITCHDSCRLSGNEKVVEADDGIVDIVEGSKSIVSELMRRDTVKTISQPSTVTANNEESSLDEGIEGNDLIARIVRVNSEIMGTGAEVEKPGKKLKDEVPEKVREAGSRELPSSQSMLRGRSEVSRIDNTFREYNSEVSVSTPGIKEVQNGDVEIMDENSMGRESDDKKSTVLTQQLSDIPTWRIRDEYSSTNGNVRDVTISGGTGRGSAGAADVAASVVELERENGESSNESARSEGLESRSDRTPPAEEDSHDSRTEKASSLSEMVISDATETGGRSSVSELIRSKAGENTAGSSVKMMDNEDDGISSNHDKSCSSEADESRPFSPESVITMKESVMGVESRGREDEEITRTGPDDGGEDCEENERSELNEWEEDGKIRSTEWNAKDKENKKDETERCSLGDHDQDSLTSQENVKSSGANSTNDACHFPNYYQNWVLSKPPPLPLDEDDDDDDEEWL